MRPLDPAGPNETTGQTPPNHQSVPGRGPALLALPEDQWFDRKSSRVSARDLADAMIALPMPRAGSSSSVFWNGRVEGVSGNQASHLAAWQQAALDFTVPAVPCRSRLVDCIDDTGTPSRLDVFDVETSQQVHANRKDEVFLRVGDESLGLARAEILEQLPTRRALGRGRRFEKVGLVPQDAWLEAVVNAVVHRSYSVSGDHIRVEIFDDRVEAESPGRFPGIADMADPLQVTRFARNPRIARVCADLAFGQELGEGIRRMFEEMRLAGLADPEYFQTSGSVRLTLSSSAVDRELESRLPPGSRDLVRVIRGGGRMSTGDLVQTTGRSRPVVIRQLNALRNAGVIRWVGNSPKDPRAYWTLHLE
jgi:hypothetical protein